MLTNFKSFEDLPEQLEFSSIDLKRGEHRLDLDLLSVEIDVTERIIAICTDGFLRYSLTNQLLAITITWLLLSWRSKINPNYLLRIVKSKHYSKYKNKGALIALRNSIKQGRCTLPLGVYEEHLGSCIFKLTTSWTKQISIPLVYLSLTLIFLTYLETLKLDLSELLDTSTNLCYSRHKDLSSIRALWAYLLTEWRSYSGNYGSFKPQEV